MSCLSKHRFHFVCNNGVWECVEERGEERYCWRAGVMSRNERGRRGTLGVNGFLLCESPSLVKSDSKKRRHVCL